MKKIKPSQEAAEDKDTLIGFVRNFLTKDQVNLINHIKPDIDAKKNALMLIGDTCD